GAGPLQALEGVVARVTYRNPENHYTVLRLELTEGGLATVVGLFPGVEAGERIRARGGWTVHPTYGRQFKADSFQPLQPVDAAGVERYLASGAIPGVGPALARRLVERFGDETLEVMESQPHRLQEVPGIGRKKAAAIAASTRARKASRAGLLFLQGHGVTPGVAARIVRQYGDETVRLIRENPYRLADEVWGIGFRRADEIARNLNFPADSPLRAQSALLHVLREAASEGHVCLPRREL